MTRNLFLSMTIIVLMVTAIAQAQMKKYDIKSGIITFQSIMKMGDFEIKKKIIVYFDDFGMKECRETYDNNKLEESYFSDGKEIYSVKHKQKAAFKQGSASRGTELCVEWTEFGTEKDRQSGKYKKLPAMKVTGKNCEMFEYNDGRGSVTLYGGWKKILLYMELKSKDMQSIQRAIKVEENVPVSSDKFKVPDGYKVEK
jgi:hypothetical protein